MTRVTNGELGERMADIEGQLKHLPTAADIRALSVNIAELNERLKAVEGVVPELRQHSARDDKRDGVNEAGEANQARMYSIAAIVISVPAALATFLDWISR